MYSRWKLCKQQEYRRSELRVTKSAISRQYKPGVIHVQNQLSLANYVTQNKCLRIYRLVHVGNLRWGYALNRKMDVGERRCLHSMALNH